MIAAAEVRRLAGAWNADPTLVERDYVLSWLLGGLYGRSVLGVAHGLNRHDVSREYGARQAA